MPTTRPLEIPIAGMDCAECTMHVKHAIESVPGVQRVEVLLGAEKAIIETGADGASLEAIRAAVAAAGYTVPQSTPQPSASTAPDFNRKFNLLLVGLFTGVAGIVIFGEWLGLFNLLNARVPFGLGLVLVLAGGFPVFRNVIRATLRRQVISHTLMTVGVLAALAVGEWVTAAIVVIFMRVGDYVENFTAQSARRAMSQLSTLAPQFARIERDGAEVEIPAGQVQPGQVVIVRPGETIPVDGEVLDGQATINQSAITGEAMPFEAGPGARVYAASLAQLGSLRVRAERAGTETTFGRVIKLVEEAEANRAEVQRFADKFSAWYLPLVAGLAALTYLFSRNPLATAAVLLVACSCSIALATPVAMLASIGASARRGLLIKGGKYLEALARADVLLVDKTGTLTLGQPAIRDVLVLQSGMSRARALALAAAAERYSEHPLAQAVRDLAKAEAAAPLTPQDFRALPGVGVQARVDGHTVKIGSRRMLGAEHILPQAGALEAQGYTLLYLMVDDTPAAIFAASDTLRPEVPAALQAARAQGIRHIELLTGDNEQAASALAASLGIACRAGLLPEDKIAIVRAYQSRGQVVVMVGDGVNDAPALAQADVGIAMGAAGSDVAIEAAHIALMRDDWMLIPDMLKIARRTMGVVKTNLGLTAIYNLAGLTLAALGILPPVLAAAAQSLPDVGIMANSARLLRQD